MMKSIRYPMRTETKRSSPVIPCSVSNIIRNHSSFSRCWSHSECLHGEMKKFSARHYRQFSWILFLLSVDPVLSICTLMINKKIQGWTFRTRIDTCIDQQRRIYFFPINPFAFPNQTIWTFPDPEKFVDGGLGVQLSIEMQSPPVHVPCKTISGRFRFKRGFVSKSFNFTFSFTTGFHSHCLRFERYFRVTIQNVQNYQLCGIWSLQIP